MAFQPKNGEFNDVPRFKAPQPISICFGDGIGPEIMKACLRVVLAAGARLELEPVDMGEAVYRSGNTAGIAPEAWDSLRRTKVLYKAPITTPQGGGLKSLNVTIRKSLGLFANVRPCTAYAPSIATNHPGMDVVIIRENEEDLYAGIEHRQTADVYQCLKLITRPGTERIVRYAFEYARAHGRKKVTCFTKDNIMKLTDGLFHRIFDEIGAQYPELEKDHWIIDIGAAKLATAPQDFDVIVTPNLYGDIVSDVAAELAGSIGLAASANVGEHCAMFEAIHGSAPSLAGKDLANPSGLLLAGVEMLGHIGQCEAAKNIHNAWLKTVEDGIHTFDVFGPTTSKQQVGTQAFAEAVIARLGEKPTTLASASGGKAANPVSNGPATARKPPVKTLVGVDVFVDWPAAKPDQVAAKMQQPVEQAVSGFVDLVMITNRGIKVWPDGLPETFCTDHWRVRYLARDGKAFNHAVLVEMLRTLTRCGIDFIKTEGLYAFDGEPGYSLGQGQ